MYNKSLFWSKVDITPTCWNWTGALDEKGYGIFNFLKKTTRTHRYSYEQSKGKIPNGLQIDHLCRNRKCINPDHLETVTSRENQRRSPLTNMNKTHCPQGHEYSKENTYHTSDKRRQCKTCINYSSKLSQRKIRQRKKLEGVN